MGTFTDLTSLFEIHNPYWNRANYRCSVPIKVACDIDSEEDCCNNYFDTLASLLSADIFEDDAGNNQNCDTVEDGEDEGVCAALRAFESTKFLGPRSTLQSDLLNNIQGMSGFSKFEEITNYFKEHAQETRDQCRRGVQFCDKERFFDKLDLVMSSNLFESNGTECSCQTLLSTDLGCGIDFFDMDMACKELAEFAETEFPIGITGPEIVRETGMFDIETLMSMNTDKLFADIEEYAGGNIPWHYELVNTIVGSEQTRPEMIKDIKKGYYAAAQFQQCQTTFADTGAEDLSTVDKVEQNFQKFSTFLSCIRSINPENGL